ncbi:MAG: hypothetical protein KDK33_04410 [Leptospiraceae bacterium]|nr:hypothetical protein [Leptospiraceae bacterium]
MSVQTTSGKVALTAAESLIKLVRLLASSGKANFKQYLVDPLLYASWKRDYSAETSARIMARIEKQADAHPHTVAPLCKRLVGESLTESPSAVGNASIFFLEMSVRYHKVSVAKETLEFVDIIQGPLTEFERILSEKTTADFERKLAESTDDQLAEAFQPVELGRSESTVRLNQEARILFEKIKRSNQKDDMAACRKLIATYLIRFADGDENNRDEVERLIDALEQRTADFRKQLHDFMAIELFYRISQGIGSSDLKKTVQGIRKYAFIFQGDPQALYHKDIDRLEKQLYTIIRKKGLMDKLIRSR